MGRCHFSISPEGVGNVATDLRERKSNEDVKVDPQILFEKDFNPEERSRKLKQILPFPYKDKGWNALGCDNDRPVLEIKYSLSG